MAFRNNDRHSLLALFGWTSIAVFDIIMARENVIKKEGVRPVKKTAAALLLLLVLMVILPGQADGQWICSGCGKRIPNAMGDICPYCFTQKQQMPHETEPAPHATQPVHGETESAPHATQPAFNSAPTDYDRFEQSHGMVRTVADFVRRFNTHTDAMDTEFEIMVTEEVREALLGSGNSSGGYFLLTRIRANCGIISLSYYTKGLAIGFKNVEYYPGRRILYAYRYGKENELKLREQQTLSAALAIVSNAKGTDLERERQIHDQMCDRIVYYTDDIPHNDNDCAIGALLDGRADCDGYADAFYLCCSLAGLETRYQHGETVPSDILDEDGGNQVEQDGTHMWNLIKVNGKWTMVDVTWDDNDKGHSYLYYNIGTEQASGTHIWDEKALAVDLMTASDNTCRNADLAQIDVKSWDELYQLFLQASSTRSTRVCFRCPASLDIRKEKDRLNTEVHSVGIKDFNWDLGNGAAEIYQIEYENHFAICGSAEEIISYVHACAFQGITDFRIYLSPSIAPSMFADEMRKLEWTLANTRLQNPFSFSYNDDCRRVYFSDAVYLPQTSVIAQCNVRSMQKLYDTLVPLGISRPERILLECGFEALQSYSRQIGNALHGVGMQEFAWSFRHGFVYITNIVYYDQYRICSTREEVAAYIRDCKSRRTSSIRIYCANDDVYSWYHADQAKRFFNLLSENGCRNSSVSYNDDTRLLLVENPVW